MAMALAVRRFTVDEYHRMGEAGIFHEDDRVELLDGQIVEMTPIGPGHAGCVDTCNRLLSSLVGGGAIIRVQSPIRLGDTSEPQPDLTLLTVRADMYRRAHPTPRDVLLVIEVADTSLEYDRDVKLRAYARSGIREAWLVNLPADGIEIHRQPGPNGYADVRTARRGETIEPLLLPGVILGVDDILG